MKILFHAKLFSLESKKPKLIGPPIAGKFASKAKSDGKDMDWFKNLNSKKEPAPPPAIL